MNNRLWIVCFKEEGSQPGQQIWRITDVSTDTEVAVESYRKLQGCKLLLLWTVSDGVEIWKSQSWQTNFGEDLNHKPLPWAWLLSPVDRAALHPLVYEAVRQFVKGP